MVAMDIIGEKYGRLTVIAYDGKDGEHVMVKCKCDCGNYIRTRRSRVISGHTKSCGCYRRDKMFKHGKRNTKLFNRWCLMRRRCNSSNDRFYEDYGGRGIKVCDEWNNSFQQFYDWAMANGYDDSLTIDRIDNDGNYEPSNCRWVTMKVQSNNTRKTRHITYQGKTMTITEWAELTGIARYNICERLKRGWPIGEVLGFEPHTNTRDKRNA